MTRLLVRDVGQRIRQLRLKAGLSQRALAEGTGGVVTYAYISRIENGERTASSKALRAVAAVLGVTEWDLVGGEVCPCCLRGES
jgi:transcriptional regulator with XRE-family HTH domain